MSGISTAAKRRVRRILLVGALALGFSFAASPAAQAATVLKSSPYYLSWNPANAWAPKKAGIVLMLHAGGWIGDLGPVADQKMAGFIAKHRQAGYDVANLGYRSGSNSFSDAVAAVDYLRKAYPSRKLCIFGTSAGAHLALLTAAARPGAVTCVIDLAGPPDLVNVGNPPQAAEAKQLAIDTWGANNLALYSPISWARSIKVPVLIGAADCDIFTSLDRQRAFYSALLAAGGRPSMHVFAPGNEVYGAHCMTSRASWDAWSATELALLNQQIGS